VQLFSSGISGYFWMIKFSKWLWFALQKHSPQPPLQHHYLYHHSSCWLRGMCCCSWLVCHYCRCTAQPATTRFLVYFTRACRQFVKENNFIGKTRSFDYHLFSSILSALVSILLFKSYARPWGLNLKPTSRTLNKSDQVQDCQSFFRENIHSERRPASSRISGSSPCCYLLVSSGDVAL